MSELYRWLRILLFALIALPLTVGGATFGRLFIWIGLAPLPRLQRIAGSKLNRRWNIVMVGLARAFRLLELTVDGEVPPDGNVLVVANHQSLLDIAVLHAAIGHRHLIRYVVKKELKWGIPAISASCRLAGYAFVDRNPGARGQNVRELTRFAEQLRPEGATGVLFPEGTWEPHGEPLAFKTAGFKTLMRAVPFDVLPVVISGTWRAQRGRDLPANLGKLRIRVVVKPLVPSSEIAADPTASLKLLEETIHTELKRLSS